MLQRSTRNWGNNFRVFFYSDSSHEISFCALHPIELLDSEKIYSLHSQICIVLQACLSHSLSAASHHLEGLPCSFCVASGQKITHQTSRLPFFYSFVMWALINFMAHLRPKSARQTRVQKETRFTIWRFFLTCRAASCLRPATGNKPRGRVVFGWIKPRGNKREKLGLRKKQHWRDFSEITGSRFFCWCVYTKIYKKNDQVDTFL